MDLEFYVDSYGAAGDGITNDAYAINAAVAAAKAAPADDVKHIIFSCEKTYRISGVPDNNRLNCLFCLDCTENISIEGKGAKLLFSGKNKLAFVTHSRNFRIEGFVIDYSPKPFILSELISFSTENRTMEFKAQEDIGIDGQSFTPDTLWFVFPNRSDIRYHYFIEKFENLGDKRYRLTVNGNTANRIADAEIGDEFLLPNINGSHQAGAMCTIMDCEGFFCGCLRFYCLPEFGFDIRMNKGNMRFDNIAFKPCENAREKLVSWRDGFHIKDNTEPIVWEKCYIGPLGDDAFNISCVHLDVTYAGEDGKTVWAFPAEKGKTRELFEGDAFVAYALDSGKLIGEGKVSRVIPSENDVRFVSDTELPGLEKGMQISFYRFANPGFSVRNSYIEGTVRVRGSGAFENCSFNVFWVRIENEYFVEGPVPKNITFRNCEFTTPYGSDAEIFHVGTLSRVGSDCEYKCRNIVLDGCRFVKGTYHADEGNELTVK